MELINSDCIEYLKSVPRESFDICLTSPPYNMNLRIRNGKHCSRQIVKEISTKYTGFSDNLSMDELFVFNCNVIDELLRVSKINFYNIQFLTGNKSAFFRIMGKYHDRIKEVIIWDKINAQPSISERTLNSQFEVLLVLEGEAISRRFKKANFTKGTLSNVLRIPRGKKYCPTHGASFPIELADTIISNFSNIGDRVLDPFMGTGTTGASSLSLGRSFVGVEIDKGYFELSKERLEIISSNISHTEAMMEL